MVDKKYKTTLQNKKSLEDFSLLVVIGKGTYAKVFLIKEKTNNQIRAMKVLKK